MELNSFKRLMPQIRSYQNYAYPEEYEHALAEMFR
jgi:hypothetical protein